VLKQHKNILFKTIQESGFPLSLFQTSENEDDWFIISIHDTPLQFWIKQSYTSFNDYQIRRTRFGPGFPLEQIGWDFSFPITYVSATLDEWLKSTVKEYFTEEQTPDLWPQIEIYQSLVTTSTISEEDYRYFSAEEKEQIQLSLLEFHRLVIENFNPTQEQLASINERLDYLGKAVDRLNRFDWKGIALSVVVSIAINLTVDTEGGRLLLKLFQQSFEAIIKLLA
jgi:hypothetical protein